MKIGTDKIKHAVVCWCITIAVAFAIIGVCTWYGAEPPKMVCGAVGACLALIAGVGKEASDYISNRKFDFTDLLADVIGAAIGIVLILLS